MHTSVGMLCASVTLFAMVDEITFFFFFSSFTRRRFLELPRAETKIQRWVRAAGHGDVSNKILDSNTQLL